MNDTIVIWRVPGRGPEVWIETVFDRHYGCNPFRRASLGDREEAVRWGEAMLWVDDTRQHE